MSTLETAFKHDLTENVKSKAHLPGHLSISSIGHCIGKQILKRLEPSLPENWGMMVPGTVGHVYRQELYPPGSMIDKTFLVLGHEQMVLYFSTQKLTRASHADTVVLNVKTNQIEIWDWKHTMKDMKYVTEVDDEYIEQITFYAQHYKTLFDLTYNPQCRVIYISKSNWDESKVFAFESDPELFQTLMAKISAIDDIVKNPDQIGPRWEELAEGVNVWSHTKTPYRKQCKYCDYTDQCLGFLGKAWNQTFKSHDDYSFWIRQARAGQQQLPVPPLK
jgi:hypothetical protein